VQGDAGAQRQAGGAVGLAGEGDDEAVLLDRGEGAAGRPGGDSISQVRMPAKRNSASSTSAASAAPARKRTMRGTGCSRMPTSAWAWRRTRS